MGSLNLLGPNCSDTESELRLLASTSSLLRGQPIAVCGTIAGPNTPISPYAAEQEAARRGVCYHHLYEMGHFDCRLLHGCTTGGRPDMCISVSFKWIDEGTPIELFGERGAIARFYLRFEQSQRLTIAALKPAVTRSSLGRRWHAVSLNTSIEMLAAAMGKKPKILGDKTFRQGGHKTTSADISKVRLARMDTKVDLDARHRRVGGPGTRPATLVPANMQFAVEHMGRNAGRARRYLTSRTPLCLF